MNTTAKQLYHNALQLPDIASGNSNSPLHEHTQVNGEKRRAEEREGKTRQDKSRGSIFTNGSPAMIEVGLARPSFNRNCSTVE